MTLLISELCWRFGYRCINSLQTPTSKPTYTSTRNKMIFFSRASSSSFCYHGESSPRLPLHQITNANLKITGTPTKGFSRSYFTNTEEMKKSDPYAALGLTWGATTTEIKAAYHRLARELHPDVSDLDPVVALNKFRVVRDAYDRLMNNKNSTHRSDLWEEWSFAVWRSGDMIAQERKDVAGVMRKRPVRPAESLKKGKGWGIAALGHPDGRGRMGRRGGEYLADGDVSRKFKSSTVGTGRSKWVSQKEFQPWTPDRTKLKGVSGLKSTKTAKEVKTLSSDKNSSHKDAQTK